MKLKELFNRIPGQIDILSRQDYRNASVLVPFIQKKEELFLLFEKRSNNIRQAGEISFPGGLINIGKETGEQTAIRETCEELNIKPENISLNKQFHTLVTPHATILEVYLGELNNVSFPLAFNKNEVEKILIVPLTFFQDAKPEKYWMNVSISPYKRDKKGQKITLFPAKKIGVDKKYESIWNECRYPIYVYRYQNELIWGMTAQIVFELMSYIK